VFKPDEVASLKSDKVLSLHSADVLGVIELGKTLGEKLAEIHIVAVQPEFVGPREGLSDRVLRALPNAVEEVKTICPQVARQ